MVEPQNKDISIKRQCELLSLSRSSYYKHPRGERDEDTILMNAIDEIYTRLPFYGSRRISKELRRAKGIVVNRKRVQRLMRKMGLEAIYPRPNVSRANKAHKKYPYLLRGMEITRPNQVWASDITYIRIERGFMYLTVVMDWYSRSVLSWRLSNTLDSSFCVEALEEALGRYGRPEIFNTDQGSQYTSESFTKVLLDEGIQISMNGKGRALDNVFVERLWRSVKYEEVYLRSYSMVQEVRSGLKEYFRFYNQERMHQSLDYRVPMAVYFDNQGGKQAA